MLREGHMREGHVEGGTYEYEGWARSDSSRELKTASSSTSFQERICLLCCRLLKKIWIISNFIFACWFETRRDETRKTALDLAMPHYA